MATNVIFSTTQAGDCSRTNHSSFVQDNCSKHRDCSQFKLTTEELNELLNFVITDEYGFILG